MRVFLDTNVLLDVALDRAPHARPASALLDLLERRVGSGHVAWHTVSNVFYIIAKDKTNEKAKAFIAELLRFVRVAPVSTESLQRALKLAVSDFEDAMQIVCAEACNADVIATRNTKDYRRSPIQPMTPAKVLGQLQSNAGGTSDTAPDIRPARSRRRHSREK